MKKKVLIVLLVLLLVGALALTAFACNKDKSSSNTKKEPTEKEETLKASAATTINGLCAGLDEVLKVATTVNDQVSIGATLYLDVEIPGDNKKTTKVGYELRLSASADQKKSANTWASIELYDRVQEATVLALFANTEAENKEILYVGQPFTTGSLKWSKLAQAQDAGLLNGDGMLVDTIFNAIGELKKSEMGASIEGGLISGFMSSIMTIAGTVFGSVLPPANGSDYITSEGLEFTLDVGGIGALIDVIGGESIAEMLSGISDYMGIINFATNLLLGAPLEDMLDPTNKIDTANAPTINLKVLGEAEAVSGKQGKKDVIKEVKLNTFTGLELSYVKAIADKGNISVKFGIKDLAFTNVSQTSPKPYGNTSPDELVLKVSVGVDLPAQAKGAAFAASSAQIDVYVNPAVNVSIYGEDDGDRKGYVKVDFSGLDGYATLSVENGTPVVIAEYVNGEGFYIDLAEVVKLTTKNPKIQGKYFIPMNAQEMYNGWIDGMIAGKQSESGDAKASVQSASAIDDIIVAINNKKPKTDKDGNPVLDENGEQVMETPLAPLLSAIVKAVFQEGNLLNDVMAILKDETILDTTVDPFKEYGAQVFFEKLMDNLLVTGGLIGSMDDKLDVTTIKLYNPNGENNAEAHIPLKQLLAKDSVFGYVVNLINAIIYDARNDEAKDGKFNEFVTKPQSVNEKEIKSLLEMVGLDTTKVESDLYDGLSLAVDLKFGTESNNGLKAELAVNQGTRKLAIRLAVDILDASAYENKGLGAKTEIQGEGDAAHEVALYESTGSGNEDALYDTLKTIANAVLPSDFQISLSSKPETEPTPEPEE